MNYKLGRYKAIAPAHFPVHRKLSCLVLLIGCSGLLAQNPGDSANGAGVSNIRSTHILGLQGVSKSAGGKLSIDGDSLKFQKTEGPSAQVPISSIQDVSLGLEDRQVGGVPLALGRAATPYAGGRVIGLFSHKKFDTLTLEYLDSDGGLHGAIFEISKGQAEAFKNALVAKGAHVKVEGQTAAASTPEVKK